jgi:glucose-6-phosphate dehydrogenase assembly protein OpcA
MTLHAPVIQVGNIDEELNKLWESQAQKNQVRACLFNLIIYSHEQRRAAYLHQIVQAILDKFPCRIIFIQAVKDVSEEFLRASVSNAMVGQGDVTIACDQINIDATENQIHRVPFVVLPILVPDLPVYLVWGQDPTSEERILPHLQRFASRLIFDSESADNLPDFSQKILHLLDTTSLEIRDVKWASIGGWRDIFTQTFDSPQRIEHLRTCKDLQITYNGRKSIFVTHTEITPLYFQAWIAAQFDWILISMETKEEFRHLNYRSGEHKIRVTLIPEDIPDLTAGSLTSIQVQSSDADETTYTIIRQAEQPRVAVHLANLEKCDIPFFLPLNELTNSTAFMAEIFYRKTSHHYRNMLAAIAMIKEQK